ncbi:mannitol dehydrogenase family protein [Acidomonas methanolica]|uniref:NADPH-dependent L-sorbose reductase/D-mannonate oxidoreductase n=2 Tax=Acidomonas methanolica TaxID=437 RepID=A0A023D1Y4_ACIMT|nr:mannitol dehydrogenase family protein [Acidomonas methanolica]MBU2654053.1 mannitol dehydrogenase family protein [Acidomonas methanolica]TCS30717.1 fructuronate reductase [Acidomonas methanolica]GAJ28152.1 NADPH-dependent L-sorbose reductase/D-mannonate oxidoreductase [Acidomonas methanolica NBRC 104435]GEK98895.1 mannitol dehydrogenase [Acidomonas methanolica NBRC 104435]
MRLCREALAHLPSHVYRPDYDVSRLQPGIVHLGCGSFHRAHQVTATQAAINAMGEKGLRWGIATTAMRRPELVRQLARQDNLFTLLTREPHDTTASVIGSITDSLFAGDPEANLAGRIADPRTRIVTLTVTASGYYLTADNRLDPEADAILADLRRLDEDQPARTATGLLVQGLAQVRAGGGVPPVILCCDNVAHNGATLRRAVTDFAALSGRDALADWIEATVQFPDTMVDRITPTTFADDIADARRLLGGIEDAVPVPAEPWFEWIIGEFEGPRPDWEAHEGTQFVPDVAVFERAKLQMLNGTHMILAYVGGLAGLTTIAEAAADPVLGPIAAHFMRNEQSAGVELPAPRLDRYTRNLMKRFRNPAIVHQVERIGRNGSAKMAARVIRPMRENLLAGRPVTGAVLLIASWIRWFALHEQEALEISITDPRAKSLRLICAEARDDHRAQAEAFLAMEEVFGPPLPRYDHIVSEIAALLHRFDTQEIRQVLADLAADI